MSRDSCSGTHGERHAHLPAAAPPPTAAASVPTSRGSAAQPTSMPASKSSNCSSHRSPQHSTISRNEQRRRAATTSAAAVPPQPASLFDAGDAGPRAATLSSRIATEAVSPPGGTSSAPRPSPCAAAEPSAHAPPTAHAEWCGSGGAWRDPGAFDAVCAAVDAATRRGNLVFLVVGRLGGGDVGLGGAFCPGQTCSNPKSNKAGGVGGGKPWYGPATRSAMVWTRYQKCHGMDPLPEVPCDSKAFRGVLRRFEAFCRHSMHAVTGALRGSHATVRPHIVLPPLNTHTPHLCGLHAFWLPAPTARCGCVNGAFIRDPPPPHAHASLPRRACGMDPDQLSAALRIAEVTTHRMCCSI
eukprot:43231-Chlamydomonas_euryale.AAC.1